MLDTIRGASGTVLAVVAPLIEFLEPIIQFGGAAGGLYLIHLSIRNKKLDIKKKERELDEGPE